MDYENFRKISSMASPTNSKMTFPKRNSSVENNEGCPSVSQKFRSLLATAEPIRHGCLRLSKPPFILLSTKALKVPYFSTLRHPAGNHRNGNTAIFQNKLTVP